MDSMPPIVPPILTRPRKFRMGPSGVLPPASSSQKTNLPMPTYDAAHVAPVIFDLKKKVNELNASAYRTSGPLMKQKVEQIFTDLAGEDFTKVLAAFKGLSEMLIEPAVYAYEPYLSGQADRIILLLAKQFTNFHQIYSKQPIPAVPAKSVKLNDEFYQFFNSLSYIFEDFVHGPLSLAETMSLDAAYQLVLSILPYMVHISSPYDYNKLYTGSQYRYGSIYYPVKYIIDQLFACSYSTLSEDEEDDDADEAYYLERYLMMQSQAYYPKMASFPRNKVIALFIRLYREFLAMSQEAEEGATSVKVVHKYLNVIGTFLGSSTLSSAYYLGGPPFGVGFDVLICEASKLFDAYSGITLRADSNMNTKPLEDVKRFLTKVFKPPLPTMMRKQGAKINVAKQPMLKAKFFALLDRELKEQKRSDDSVPFYKWLASIGVERPKVNEAEEELSAKKKALAETKVSFSPADMVAVNVVELFRQTNVAVATSFDVKPKGKEPEKKDKSNEKDPLAFSDSDEESDEEDDATDGEETMPKSGGSSGAVPINISATEAFEVISSPKADAASMVVASASTGTDSFPSCAELLEQVQQMQAQIVKSQALISKLTAKIEGDAKPKEN